LQSVPQNDVERALSVLLGLKCCGEYFASLRVDNAAASVKAGAEEAGGGVEEEKREEAVLPDGGAPSSSCAGQGVTARVKGPAACVTCPSGRREGI
jgi:hypothetical protein